MKTRLALLGLLAIVVIVWFQRGAPNPLAIAAGRRCRHRRHRLTHPNTPGRSVRSPPTSARWRGTVANRAIRRCLRVERCVPWRADLLDCIRRQPNRSTWRRQAQRERSGRSTQPSLLAMSADAILKSSIAASSALKRDMRNPRAHEAAALTLAAFAMRESAEGMSDTRWALNRMTAHLAMAQALRNGRAGRSVDGLLAAAALARADRSPEVGGVNARCPHCRHA